MKLTLKFWPVMGLLLLCGCGSSGQNSTTIYQATGKILLVNGQPLRGAQVRLVAKLGPNRGGADAFGSVETDGTFKLLTLDNKEGAMPGMYKVVITPRDNDPKTSAADKAFARQNIPTKYTSEDTTDLEAEIKSGTN